MITFETFLLGLLICSALTSLATEAVKKILTELNTNYHANLLAGIMALAVSLMFSGGYIIYTGSPITGPAIVCSIALIFLSWLCAMLGYDKVIQSIKQIAG